jgi:hypothetical protein
MKEVWFVLAVLAGVCIWWAGGHCFGPARVFQRTAKVLSHP